MFQSIFYVTMTTQRKPRSFACNSLFSPVFAKAAMSGSTEKTMYRSESDSTAASKSDNNVRTPVQQPPGSWSEVHMGEDRARDGKQRGPACGKWRDLLGMSASQDEEKHGVEKHDCPPESATRAEHSVERKERSTATPYSDTQDQDPRRSMAGGSQDQLGGKVPKLHLSSGVDGRPELNRRPLYRNQRLPVAPEGMDLLPYELAVVIDFKVVCQVKNDTPIIEIIEFPAVLFDVRQKEVVDIFREFCKPVFTAIPGDYYNSLTAANQSEVNNGSTFPQVLKRFEQWLDYMTLWNLCAYCVVTDGTWDMARFLTKQCEISQIPLPVWSRRFVNICKSYASFYSTRQLSLKDMLGELEMPFEGRKHSGLDEARSIVRVVGRMLEDGYKLKVNEKLDPGHAQATSRCSRPHGCSGLLDGPPRKIVTNLPNPRDTESAPGASASTSHDAAAAEGSQSLGSPQAAEDETSLCEEEGSE